MQLFFGSSLGENTSWLIGWGEGEANAGPEPSQITWGLYHKLGGGLRLWYEGMTYDADAGGPGDLDRHVFGMRFDF